MKSLKIFAAMILLISFICGCDYVVPNKQATSGTTDTATYIRKVLVEDYTGHQCGNCPPAAEALEALIGLHPSNIVPIAVHAGSNAQTVQPYYSTNFIIQEATDWDTHFAMSSRGNPCGMVNRGGYTLYSGWAALADAFLATPASMNIKIVNHFNAADSTITDSVICKYLQATDSTYMLSVVITEDSIIDHQADDRLVAPHDIPNYVFNHMMRATMNGAWGDTLSKGSQAAMTTFTKNYTFDMRTPKIKVPRHCHVVAFIYSAVSYQVIQAEDVMVIP